MSAETLTGPRRLPPPSPEVQNATQEASTASAQKSIDNFSRLYLGQNGIDPDSFVWVMNLDSIILTAGNELKNGHLAELPNGYFCVFRYTPKDGFQLALIFRDKIQISLEKDDSEITLLLTINSDAAVKRCRIVLNTTMVISALGPWLDFCLPALCEARAGMLPESVVIGNVRIIRPQENGFGLNDPTRYEPAALGVGNDCLFLLPSEKKLRLNEVSSWKLTDGKLSVRYTDEGVPCELRVREYFSNSTGIISALTSLLPESQPDNSLPDSELAELGVFSRLEADGKTTKIILHAAEDKIDLWSDPKRPTFRFSWVLPEKTILASDSGEVITLKLELEEGEKVRKFAKTPLGLVQRSADESWILFLSDDATQKPICLTLRRGKVEFSESECRPFSSAIDIQVEPSVDGLVRVTTKWRQEEEIVELHHLAPEPQGFAFWEWWDAEKARVDVASVGTAALYSQYNAARKHNFLLVAFGDLILLNRALESGTAISALCAKLEDVGPEKFSADEKLRDETVAKTMLLASSLQEIKQKYELLSAMAPYYWVQREAAWLCQAFGSKEVKSLMTTERHRLVPTLRRQFRTIQSDLFRSLGQIEGGIRPLEGVLSREEVKKQWTSKTRTYLPAAAQVGIGVAALVATGGTAWYLLAGAFATHGLGNVLGIFQKDTEAAAQVRRAAQSIFPWWQIFMRTLFVAIYEAGEFMDTENENAMKRDKKLLEAVPEEDRSGVLKRLNSLLRQRIIEERRSRFGEVIEGSGVRVMQIIDDIEKASGEQMKDAIDSFVDTLVLTGKRKK